MDIIDSLIHRSYSKNQYDKILHQLANPYIEYGVYYILKNHKRITLTEELVKYLSTSLHADYVKELSRVYNEFWYYNTNYQNLPFPNNCCKDIQSDSGYNTFSNYNNNLIKTGTTLRFVNELVYCTTYLPKKTRELNIPTQYIITQLRKDIDLEPVKTILTTFLLNHEYIDDINFYLPHLDLRELEKKYIEAYEYVEETRQRTWYEILTCDLYRRFTVKKPTIYYKIDFTDFKNEYNPKPKQCIRGYKKIKNLGTIPKDMKEFEKIYQEIFSREKCTKELEETFVNPNPFVISTRKYV